MQDCHALLRNKQLTNQCAAQSWSFTCTFLCSEEALTTIAESVRENLSETSNSKSLCVVMELTMSGQQKSVVYEFNI